MTCVSFFILLLAFFAPVRMQSSDGAFPVDDTGLVVMTIGGFILFALAFIWFCFCYKLIRIGKEARSAIKDLDRQNAAALARRRRARQIEMIRLNRAIEASEAAVEQDTETEINPTEHMSVRVADEDGSNDDWFFNGGGVPLVREEEPPPPFETVVSLDEQMHDHPYPSSSRPPLAHQHRMLNTLQNLPQMTASNEPLDITEGRDYGGGFRMNERSVRNAGSGGQLTRGTYREQSEGAEREEGNMGRHTGNAMERNEHQDNQLQEAVRENSVIRTERQAESQMTSTNRIRVENDSRDINGRAYMNISSMNDYRDNRSGRERMGEEEVDGQTHNDYEERYTRALRVPTSYEYYQDKSSTDDETSDSDNSTSSIDVDELISRHLSQIPKIGMVNVGPAPLGLLYHSPNPNFQRFDPQMRVPIHPSRKLPVVNSSAHNRNIQFGQHPLSFSQLYNA